MKEEHVSLLQKKLFAFCDQNGLSIEIYAVPYHHQNFKHTMFQAYLGLVCKKTLQVLSLSPHPYYRLYQHKLYRSQIEGWAGQQKQREEKRGKDLFEQGAERKANKDPLLFLKTLLYPLSRVRCFYDENCSYGTLKGRETFIEVYDEGDAMEDLAEWVCWLSDFAGLCVPSVEKREKGKPILCEVDCEALQHPPEKDKPQERPEDSLVEEMEAWALRNGLRLLDERQAEHPLRPSLSVVNREGYGLHLCDPVSGKDSTALRTLYMALTSSNVKCEYIPNEPCVFSFSRMVAYLRSRFQVDHACPRPQEDGTYLSVLDQPISWMQKQETSE